MEEAAKRKVQPSDWKLRVRRGGGGWRYLREGERVGHRADEDLTQFPVQV